MNKKTLPPLSNDLKIPSKAWIDTLYPGVVNVKKGNIVTSYVYDGRPAYEIQLNESKKKLSKFKRYIKIKRKQDFDHFRICMPFIIAAICCHLIGVTLIPSICMAIVFLVTIYYIYLEKKLKRYIR